MVFEAGLIERTAQEVWEMFTGLPLNPVPAGAPLGGETVCTWVDVGGDWDGSILLGLSS